MNESVWDLDSEQPDEKCQAKDCQQCKRTEKHHTGLPFHSVFRCEHPACRIDAARAQ